MTLGKAWRDLRARLAAAGMATPDLDARLIVTAAEGVTPLTLATEPERALRHPDRLAALAARRLAGEPVDRLLGRREFWGLTFALSPDTLSPRPDTETIVAAALDALGGRERPLILDIGTGTGAILLALLAERPDAFGIGADRAAGAIVTARANAAANGLAGRAAFMVGDFTAALAGRFDLIVSNPPYIPSGVIASLPVEVHEHDPRLALDGGADGLAAYRAILAHAPRLLAPHGALVLELGIGQEAAVMGLAREAGLVPDGPARRDLGGVPRALTLRLNAGNGGCR